MGPFAVSSNGADVQSATGPNVLLSMTQPFTKMDVTNSQSFQTLQLLFNSEPPNPGGSMYSDTIVYQHPHTYTYAPAFWMQWQNSSPQSAPSPSPGNSATSYFQFGDDTAGYYLYSDLRGFTPSVANATGGVQFASVVYNSAGTNFTVAAAFLVATTNASNVYLHLLKESYATLSGTPFGVSVQGFTLNVRLCIFVEPGTTSTY